MGKAILAGILLCAGFASGAHARDKPPLTCEELGAYTREIVLLIQLGAKPYDLNVDLARMDPHKVPPEKSELLGELAVHLSDVIPVEQDYGDKLKIVKSTADSYEDKCNKEMGQ